MQKTKTIAVPEDIASDLEEMAREEGRTCDDMAVEAIKKYIFVRKFRTLADQMTAKAEELGIHSEQDVFDRVS